MRRGKSLSRRSSGTETERKDKFCTKCSGDRTGKEALHWLTSTPGGAFDLRPQTTAPETTTLYDHRWRQDDSDEKNDDHDNNEKGRRRRRRKQRRPRRQQRKLATTTMTTTTKTTTTTTITTIPTPTTMTTKARTKT